jgi:hypothetical protein
VNLLVCRDLGVCFRGLQGKELFPAVGFYNNNRGATFVRCEVIVPGASSAGASAATSSDDIADIAPILAKIHAAESSALVRNPRPSSHLDIAGSMLASITEIAMAWSPSILGDALAANGDVAGVSLPSTLRTAKTQKEVLPLEEPFAIQATGRSFQLLHELLHIFATRSKNPPSGVDAPKYTQLTVLTLRLIRANFDRISTSHVAASEAGIVVDGEHATLHALHELLQKLMASDEGYPEHLALEAVKTVEAGLFILYASPQTRAELLMSLIDRYLASVNSNGACVPLSPAHTELLARCLAFFSSPKGVISLLPPTLADAAEKSTPTETLAKQLSDISKLLEAILSILTSNAMTQLDSPATAAAPVSKMTVNLVQSGFVLLAAFQRHLLSLLASECEHVKERAKRGQLHSDSKDLSGVNSIELVSTNEAALNVRLAGCSWVSAFSAQRSPVAQTFSVYADLLLGCCTKIMERSAITLQAQATTLLLDGNANAGSCVRTDVLRNLQESVVGRLLPAFVGAASGLHDQAWLHADLLRQMVALFRSANSIENASQQARAHYRQIAGKSFAAAAEVSSLAEYQLLASGNDIGVVPPPVEGDEAFSSRATTAAQSELEFLEGTFYAAQDACPTKAWVRVTEEAEKETEKGKVQPKRRIDLRGAFLAPFSVAYRLSGSDAVVDVLGGMSLLPAILVPFTGVGTGQPGGELQLDISMTLPLFKEVKVEESGYASIFQTSAAKALKFSGGLAKEDVERGMAGLVSVDAKQAGSASIAACYAQGFKPIQAMDSKRKLAAGIVPVAVPALGPHDVLVLSAVKSGVLASKVLDQARAICKERATFAKRSEVVSVPWLRRFVQLCALELARSASLFIAGPQVSYEEEELRPVLRSHMFGAGLEADPQGSSIRETLGFDLQWPGLQMPANLAAEDSAVGVEGGDILKEVLDTCSVKGGVGDLVFEKFQLLVHENAIKRRAGVFPEVELPLCMAICKQTGLFNELKTFCRSVKDGDAADMPPSLAAAWKSVQIVRAFLRVQKAEFKNKKPESAAEATDDAARQGAQRKLQLQAPKTFDELLESTKQRALLVLDMSEPLPASAAPTTLPASPTLQSRSSSVSSDSMHDLQQKWSNLLPSVGLQLSRMASRGSTDSSNAPRATLARAVSWATADEGDGQADVARAASGLSAATVTAELDLLAEDAASTTNDPRESISKSIREYVKVGLGAPPALLRKLLFWRSVRALARAFAFAALYDVLADPIVNKPAEQTVVASLRSPLRGVLERQLDMPAAAEHKKSRERSSSSGSDSDSDDSEQDKAGASKLAVKDATSDALSVRHHYGNGLEGCSAPRMHMVQAAHHKVYDALGRLLREAFANLDLVAASALLWSWSCEISPQDREFVVQVGLASALGEIDVAPLRPVPPQAEWKPWHIDRVRVRLEAGSLRKADVLAHIARASAVDAARARLRTSERLRLADVTSPSGAEWLEAQKIDVASPLGIDEVMSLYSSFISNTNDSTPPVTWSPSQLAAAQLAVDTSFSYALRSQVEEESSAVGSSVSKDFEGQDKLNRDARPKRTRATTKMSGHSHPLEFSTDKVTYWCDSCGNRGDNDGIGVGMWWCPRGSCSTYYCEKCFADRSTHEEWEESPVDDVSTNFTGYGAGYQTSNLHCAVKRRAWSDDSGPKVDALPSFMTAPASRHYFYQLLLNAKGAESPVGTVAVSFTAKTGRRVRVWLGIAESLMSRVKHSNLAWVFENYDKSTTKVGVAGEKYVLFRSKRVATHASAAPSEYRDALEAKFSSPEKFEIHGLGLTGDVKNFLVFLEEVLESEMKYRDVMGEEDPEVLKAEALLGEPAETDALTKLVAISPPVDTSLLMRSSAWALTRLLMMASFGAASSAQTASDTLAPPVISPKLMPSSSIVARASGLTSLSGSLQANMVNILQQLLRSCVEALGSATQRRQSLECVEAESLASGALHVILAVCDMPSAKHIFAQRAFMMLLVGLLWQGTPLLRSQSMRVLQVICTRVEPDLLDEVVSSVFPVDLCTYWQNVCGSPSVSLGLFLDLIAAPDLVTAGLFVPAVHSEHTRKPDNALQLQFGCQYLLSSKLVGSGLAAQTLAADALTTLRTFLRFSGWRDKYAGVLVGIFSRSDELTKAFIGRTIALSDAVGFCGTLAVLGGFVEVLRLGAKVVVSPINLGIVPGSSAPTTTARTSSDIEATLVRFDQHCAHVVYSRDISSIPIAADPLSLVVVPEVPAPVALVDAVADRYHMLSSALTASTGSNPLAIHLRHMLLGVIQASLKNAAAATLAIRSGILNHLYDLALTASPFKHFASVQALLVRLRALDRAAYDFRHTSSESVGLGGALPEVSAVHALPVVSSEQCAELAGQCGVDFAFAQRILQMHSNDCDAAKEWMVAHADAYFYGIDSKVLDGAQAGSIPRGAFSGLVKLGAEDAGRAVFLLALLDVNVPTADELDEIDEEALAETLSKPECQLRLMLLRPSKSDPLHELMSHGDIPACVARAVAIAIENESDPVATVALNSSTDGALSISEGEQKITVSDTEITLEIGPQAQWLRFSVPSSLLFGASLESAVDGPTEITLSADKFGERSFSEDASTKFSDSAVLDSASSGGSDASGSDDDDSDDEESGKSSDLLLADVELVQPSATGLAGAAGEEDFKGKTKSHQNSSVAVSFARAGYLPHPALELVELASSEPPGSWVFFTDPSSHNATPALEQLRSGIVLTADTVVHVVELDCAKGSVSTRRVDPKHLRKLTRLHGVEAAGYGPEFVSRIQVARSQTTEALCLHGARYAIQSLLLLLARDDAAQVKDLSSPSARHSEFSLEAAGGSSKLLSLIRVVSANDASVTIGRNSRGTTIGSSSSGAANAKQAEQAGGEEGATAALQDPSSSKCASYSIGMASLAGLRYVYRQLLLQEKQNASISSETESLSSVLVQDCIKNFVRSLKLDQSRTAVAESVHPLPAEGVYTGVLELPGADSIALAFDAMSSSSKKEILSLFTSSTMDSAALICRFGGPAVDPDDSDQEEHKTAAFRSWPSKPVVVAGSKVWWKLECGHARPIRALQEAKKRSQASKPPSNTIVVEESSVKADAPIEVEDIHPTLEHTSQDGADEDVHDDAADGTSGRSAGAHSADDHPAEGVPEAADAASAASDDDDDDDDDADDETMWTRMLTRVKPKVVLRKPETTTTLTVHIPARKARLRSRGCDASCGENQCLGAPWATINPQPPAIHPLPLVWARCLAMMTKKCEMPQRRRPRRPLQVTMMKALMWAWPRTRGVSKSLQQPPQVNGTAKLAPWHPNPLR